MRLSLRNPRVRFHIGDVRRDRHGVDCGGGWRASTSCSRQAAALKQVPSCEFFPMQAVMTNVVGSYNVIESAAAHDVPRVVCPRDGQGGVSRERNGYDRRL